MAISAKNGTSASLFSENYRIDFHVLIRFWRLVAVFCYLSRPCAWLPKWRSRVWEVKASPDPVDAHERGTALLPSLEGALLLCLIPHAHPPAHGAVPSAGRHEGGLPSGAVRGPGMIPEKGIARSLAGKLLHTVRLMSQINTVLKISLMTELVKWVQNDARQLLRNKTLEKWYGAVDSYSENVEGKKRGRPMERLSKWQHFCFFFVLQKAPGAACCQSDQQI